MSRARVTDLGTAIVQFFEIHLPNQRGMSRHTMRSYRDAIVLLLQFIAARRSRGIEELDLADLDAAAVEDFLRHLEIDRRNSIATRNVRLAAIHTLARFLAGRHADRLGAWQAIIALPFKRGVQQRPVEHLAADGVKALLDAIDRGTPSGERDFALLALMFNTGARVQEVLDLRLRDVRLDPPQQVRLKGKGNKVRVCPIWPRTAQLLADLVRRRSNHGVDNADTPLFVNQRGEPLSRFGVRYVLRKYAQRSGVTTAASQAMPHPHTLRHTTAVHLLKAGVDFATISQWLGHASLNTTMRYARSDLDLKRQALSQVFPDILASEATAHVLFDPGGLRNWLRRL
jgi:site-specific recombinase XerD